MPKLTATRRQAWGQNAGRRLHSPVHLCGYARRMCRGPGEADIPDRLTESLAVPGLPPSLL